MKKHHLFAFALFATMVIFGCVDKTKTGTTDGTSDTLPEIMDTVAALPSESECGMLQPGQFCSRGLDILQLGDSLVWNANIKSSLSDGVLKDTVFSEVTNGPGGADTTSWFAKILRFPDGNIYMDADFNAEHLLGRVRIESGRYHHISGLRVGSTGKEVKAFFKDAYVIPFEEYGVMEVIVPYKSSRMIFHFPQAGIFEASKHEYKLLDILDDAKVVRIVLM